MSQPRITITRLQASALAEAAAQLSRHAYSGDLAEAHEHLQGHDDGSSDSFFADVDGAFAGFVTLRWESHNEQFRKNGTPFIHHLQVFPQFQGLGLASMLMDSAETLIATRSQFAGICVGIFDAYGPAQRLYAKRGYIPDGRGVCHNHRPIQLGEQLTIDHDLIIWLIKDVRQNTTSSAKNSR